VAAVVAEVTVHVTNAVSQGIYQEIAGKFKKKNLVSQNLI
jgi:hypothetical protein